MVRGHMSFKWQGAFQHMNLFILWPKLCLHKVRFCHNLHPFRPQDAGCAVVRQAILKILKIALKAKLQAHVVFIDQSKMLIQTTHTHRIRDQPFLQRNLTISMSSEFDFECSWFDIYNTSVWFIYKHYKSAAFVYKPV